MFMISTNEKVIKNKKMKIEFVHIFTDFLGILANITKKFQTFFVTCYMYTVFYQVSIDRLA